MSSAWLWGAAAAIAAIAGIAGFVVAEVRWRRLAARELPEEIGWGALASGDVEALSSWKRFRKGWLPGASERRMFRRIARRLARAKAVQRQAEGPRGRLLQAEILSLRTRLRRAQAGLRPSADPAGGLDLKAVSRTGHECVENGHLKDAQQ
jgi:hypothetical protein